MKETCIKIPIGVIFGDIGTGEEVMIRQTEDGFSISQHDQVITINREYLDCLVGYMRSITNL